ncbi:MAG: FkbM family methyltransferase, partial [Terriglobia bacterium]
VISDRTQTMQLHLASPLNNGGSSLFRHTKYPLRKQDVQGLTLAEFLTRYKIGKCDLMKVDIEGGEYEVFMTAGETLKSGVLRRIALDIHHPLLERRGLSGRDLHEHVLACGYTVNDDLGMPVYTFNA